MIHEEICTYEVAKLAKEKGFNVPTDHYYHIYNDVIEAQNSLEMTSDGCADFYNSLNRCRCAAPTQSLLQRWLREKKGVTICVDIFDDGWFFDISTFYKQDTGVYEVEIPYKSSNVSPVYDTYELALENALKYALKNLV